MMMDAYRQLLFLGVIIIVVSNKYQPRKKDKRCGLRDGGIDVQFEYAVCQYDIAFVSMGKSCFRTFVIQTISLSSSVIGNMMWYLPSTFYYFTIDH
jgi:hypothetical protein